MDRYEVFTRQQRLQNVSDKLNTLVDPARRSKINVSTYDKLARRLQDVELSAWYDPFPRFDLASEIRRTRSNKLFPVTVTQHTLSYAGMLRSFYLSTLLSDNYECDSIICTTEAARVVVAELLEHVAARVERDRAFHLRYNGRLDVIPLGIDTSAFKPRDKSKLRDELGWPQESVIILYLGRLSFVDKADLLPLLGIVSELRKRRLKESIYFVIAGMSRGSYITTVRNSLTELGLEDCTKVIDSPISPASLYAASDIFVSPADNIQESFGLTVLEAMASGVPQVVTDWNGYKEIVRHGITGFLVPTYWTECDRAICELSGLFGEWEFDHTALAQSVAFDFEEYVNYLQALIVNRDLRKRMGQAARDLAVQRYSSPVIAMSYDALWQELERIAKSLLFEGPKIGTYCQPAYFKTFSHYPSAIVTDEDILAITDAGARALRKDRIISKEHFANRLGIIDDSILLLLLNGLDPIGRHSGPRHEMAGDFTAAYLLDTALKNQQVPRDHLWRHVMWLVKYGLVRIERTDSRGSYVNSDNDSSSQSKN